VADHVIAMARNEYELERPLDDLDEGDVLELTARYGDWHIYDVRLEPVAKSETGSIELDVEELNAITTPAGDWESTRTPAHL